MPVYFPGLNAGGIGYGGASYGISGYGSGVFPRLPFPNEAGYGGYQYGLSSYGSVDTTSPRVTGANSLDGFRVEIFFSEEMKDDTALVSPGSYVFAPVGMAGAPIASVSVEKGVRSGIGYTSVIVTHTGSTLGGSYSVEVDGPVDVAGNPMAPSPANRSFFYALGDQTSAIVRLPSPDDGKTVLVEFLNSLGLPQDMLPESDFSPGIEDTGSYDITTEYPVVPTIGFAAQDVTQPNMVTLGVSSMTSTDYEMVLGPSLSMNYDGSILPDADSEIDGVEVGTGSSIAGVEGLILTKASANLYGWFFGDKTGRMTAGTTYRVEVAVRTLGTTITPPLVNGILAVFSVSDGTTQIDVGLGSNLGFGVLNVGSGGVSLQVPAEWNDGDSHTISVIRNQKADTFSVLLDGVPLVGFAAPSATGVPTIPGPGANFVLLSGFDVSLFRVEGVKATSSQTLFTSSWNFIHGLVVPFVGSGLLARNTVRTKHGPLVRYWGDDTPATNLDVDVKVNGISVSLAGVNPFLGEIYTSIPIPLGSVTVEADYAWMRNPVMEISGLNTKGLSLNVWDRKYGHTFGSVSPEPPGSLGVVTTRRFQMGLVLGPRVRKSPVQVGHRYTGFQKNGYSSLLNQPSTLLLNGSQRFPAGSVSATAQRSFGVFDGSNNGPTPVDGNNENSIWRLDGVDSGGPTGSGTYRVIDDSSGPYGVGTAAVYKRDFDLSIETQVTEVARFSVDSYTPDGVFTGVAVGIHDGGGLVLVGAIEVDGVKHLGILEDGEAPNLESSWEVVPKVDVTAEDRNTVSLVAGSAPIGIAPGDRFRISDGVQAGSTVYTLDSCGISTDPTTGVLRIRFQPSLPNEVDIAGGKELQLLWEVPWSSEKGLVSIRMYVDASDTHHKTVTAYVGGRISAVLANQKSFTNTPNPSQTALLIPATETGVAFWGSCSRRAKSASVWDLVQYTSTPKSYLNVLNGGYSITADMNELPEDEQDPWYTVGGQGYSTVSGGELLLRSSSGGWWNRIPQSMLYERVEPYFSSSYTDFDLKAEFRVDQGGGYTLGAGAATVGFDNTRISFVLNTLAYVQDSTGRSIIPARASVSLSGLQSPTDAENWAVNDPAIAPEPFVQQQTILIEKPSYLTGVTWTGIGAPAAVSPENPRQVSDEGMVIEAVFEIGSVSIGSTVNSTGFGVSGECELLYSLGPGSTVRSRKVTLTLGGTLASPQVQLRRLDGTVVYSTPHNWNDSQRHSYRILCDEVSDLVLVEIDGVQVPGPGTAFSGFTDTTGPARTQELKGELSLSGDGSCSVTLHSMFVIPLRTVPVPASGQSLGRTLGVWAPKPGTQSTQDIDNYLIPTSPSDATYYARNSDVSTSVIQVDWQSLTPVPVRIHHDPTWGVRVYRTDTSDLLVSAENALLPPRSQKQNSPASIRTPPSVGFGVQNGFTITRSFWTEVSYTLASNRQQSNPGRLNRSTQFKSGEFLLDTTPEVAVLTVRDGRLYIPDSGIQASRVFSLVGGGGSVLPRGSYDFNPIRQTIGLNPPYDVEGESFTVTFAPSSLVTRKYICDRPLGETVTVVNEGTPPVPNQSDPNYADLKFCSTTSAVPSPGIPISSVCDSGGLVDIELEQPSSMLNEISRGTAWASSGPTMVGPAIHNPLFGGGMVLGGGQRSARQVSQGLAVTLNRLAVSISSSVQNSKSPQNVWFSLEPSYSDLVSTPQPGGDNVPANGSSPTLNGNGAVAYVLEDFSSVTNNLPMLGPIGGIPQSAATFQLGGGNSVYSDTFLLSGGAAIPTSPLVTSGTIRAAN